MIFPICLTVNGTHLIACISEDFKKYTTALNILAYETASKAFIYDRKPLRKVTVFGEDKSKGAFFGISMLDSREEVYGSYKDTVSFDLNLDEVDLTTKTSFYESFVNKYPDIVEQKEICRLLVTISEELNLESESLVENSITRVPIIATSQLNIVYSSPSWFNEENCIIDRAPNKADEPTDRVFLPIPTVEDIVRANQVQFNTSNYMVEIPTTAEFVSPSERSDFIDENVRMFIGDLVVSKPSQYINPWYAINRIFNGTSLSPADKSERIELAKKTNSSIYRQSNMRVLGVNIEPQSEAYTLMYGKPDYYDSVYDNEIEFVMCLNNLLISTSMYQNDYYSAYQLSIEKDDITSDWFDNYLMEQIKYVLQDYYGYTGMVTATGNDSEVEDEDSFDSSEQVISMSISASAQLLKITKSVNGKFTIKLPTEDEQISKVDSHEIDTVAGINSIQWFIRDSGSPTAAISVLIQLLRFGERKNQFIHVKDCSRESAYPYMDTKTLNAVKTLIIEKPYYTVLTPSGKDYTIDGGLFLRESSNTLNIKLPVGVVLRKTETNDVNKRHRLVVMDINRFLNSIFAVKDGEPILSVNEIEYKDGDFIFDAEHINDVIYSRQYNPFDLEEARKAGQPELIVDPRVTRKQNSEVAIYCKKAGIEAPIASSNTYTFLSAYAMVDSGEIDYNPSEMISLANNSPEIYVMKNIIHRNISVVMKNQQSLLSSGRDVSMVSLLRYVYAIFKDKSDTKDAPVEGGVLFDKMISTPSEYKIEAHAIIQNSDKESVGYSFQVVDLANKGKYLLVASTKEIGLKLPVNSTGVYKILPLSKLFDKKNIIEFYSASDLDKQMDLVKETHKIVLASKNTLNQLRGE